MAISLPEHSEDSHFSLARLYFVRVMLVLSDPVCVLFSGILHVYKSDVSAAVFES